MLSEEMQAELLYASAMVCYGFLVAAAYHILLFFRALVSHIREAVDAEDILFLTVAGFGFFLTAFEKNDGILRWYAFAGFLAGGYAYYRIVSPGPERVRKWLLQKRRKAYKMKIAGRDKTEGEIRKRNQVSAGEGSSQESEEKRKKKKRHEGNCPDRNRVARRNSIQQRFTSEGEAVSGEALP